MGLASTSTVHVMDGMLSSASGQLFRARHRRQSSGSPSIFQCWLEVLKPRIPQQHQVETRPAERNSLSNNAHMMIARCTICRAGLFAARSECTREDCGALWSERLLQRYVDIDMWFNGTLFWVVEQFRGLVCPTGLLGSSG